MFGLTPVKGLVMTSVALALIGVADRAADSDFGFSLFYLVPVSVAGWAWGRGAGMICAVQAAAWWLSAEIAGSAVLPSLWNGFTRAAIYSAFGIGAGVMRADRERFRVLLERERMLSRTDPLTGLENSRAFREGLEADLARAARSGDVLSVVYLDLDNFKRINDTLGHAVGDSVLVEIAGLLRGALRKGDRAARIGGDEFALVLWKARSGEALEVAERAVRAVKKLGDRYPDTGLGASAGVASTEGAEATVDALLYAADQAMYAVKVAGKGQVRSSLPPRAP
jgi:diguanylate cyclase (GGDEF)-like protein